MKQLTILTLFSLFTVASLRADIILQDQFNYPNGQVIVTSTNSVAPTNAVWIRHSGSGNDAFVNNHRLENAATGGSPVSRQDDVHRFFPAAYTNASTIIYASFIINSTNLPNAAGTYFAHFYTNSSSFYGRLFALTGTNLCLPNTFRLGVSGVSATANAIFPVDLAMNQDYQVVFKWDPVNDWAATVWVNPTSSNDTGYESSDTVALSNTVPSQAIAFRQASSMGNWFCTISNVVVATTFNEAANTVWTPNSIAPSVKYDLGPVTNYVGVPAQLSIVAAGQGLANFVYLWQKNGAPFSNPNGNSNVLPFSSPALSDTGNYSVIVSNITTTATATSSTVLMWVTNSAPIITTQPTNQSFYAGKNLNLSVVAMGTPTITYTWLFNNAPITLANVDLNTTNTATLSITNASSIDTSSTFKCLLTNPYGSTNTAAVQLTLLTPQIVNIDTLRGMVDPTFFLPTNTTTFFTVTNAVVYTREVTNGAGDVNGGPYTAAPNAEYFIQDSSGGICVFDTGAASTQPRQGDIVTVTGPLGQFNSLLEFNLVGSDPSQSVTVTGHTNTLPAPIVLPFSFTNGSGPYVSVSNVIRHFQGALVTLTNCYFPGASVGTTFTGTSYVMTNISGGGFVIFFNSANVNIIGQTIPQFARSVTGPMSFFLSTSAANRSSGFQIAPSVYSDIVAGPNPPVGATLVNGTTPTIKWTAQPFVPYSVWWASNVALPFTNQWTPIASGLTFGTTSGTFTDSSANTNLPAGFYRISSP